MVNTTTPELRNVKQVTLPNALMRTNNFTNDPSRAIPFEPIWPGLAINTVFYAAILWGLLATCLALRRLWRIGSGLCPKCAYDLRGSKDASACPECGSIVAS